MGEHDVLRDELMGSRSAAALIYFSHHVRTDAPHVSEVLQAIYVILVSNAGKASMAHDKTIIGKWYLSQC